MPGPPPPMAASSIPHASSPMSKALTIVGMVVAGLVGLTFAVDLALEIPFDRASTTMDVGAIIASAILGYLSWDAFREAK